LAQSADRLPCREMCQAEPTPKRIAPFALMHKTGWIATRVHCLRGLSQAGRIFAGEKSHARQRARRALGRRRQTLTKWQENASRDDLQVDIMASRLRRGGTANRPFASPRAYPPCGPLRGPAPRPRNDSSAPDVSRQLGVEPPRTFWANSMAHARQVDRQASTMPGPALQSHPLAPGTEHRE
jgi:hypothetical protein